MSDQDKREQGYLDDTIDAVKRTNLDQKELKAAGDNPEKRAEARQRKYIRDTISAVKRANR